MSKLIKAASPRNNRRIETVTFNHDFDDLISQYDQSKILGQSRALYHNNPIVRSSIDKKASYSIGNAFEYRSLSKNTEVKNKLEQAIAQWAKIAEVSGKTLNDVQWLCSTNVDVDGDIFIHLVKSKERYPLVQLIEAHSVGSRQNSRVYTTNTYEEKGVIFDRKTKRPIFYRVLGKTPAEDQVISTSVMIRISEPSMSARGTPIIASAVRLLQDLEHSQELLLTQHLMATSTSMIEHNQSGAAEFDLDDSPTTSEGLNIETINHDGGEIRFLKANTGSKLEILSNPNPSIPWQEYQNTLTNMCLLALDWPSNLAGTSSATGTNDRLAISQAQKTCLDRQTLLQPHFLRICNWAISVMVTEGFLDIDLPEDWFLGYFTKPAFISVDHQRDSKVLIEEYKIGFKTLGQILAESGREFQPHVREQYKEEAERILIKAETEKEYGVPIDDLNVRLFNPTQFQQPSKDDEP